MALRFKLEGSLAEELTWDEIEILEIPKVGAAKNILARYMVDENDQPIPYEQAVKTLGKIKGATAILEAVNAFMGYIKDGAVNPPTAAS